VVEANQKDMKTGERLAVIVMGFVGSVCLYLAIEAVMVGEVICLGRGCARHISLADEPNMFYFNVGGLLFLATTLIGWSSRLVFGKKMRINHELAESHECIHHLTACPSTGC